MSNNEIREKRKKVICDLVKDDFYVPMKEKELAMFLQVAKEDREEFREILRELLAEGKLTLTVKGKYMKSNGKVLTGTFISNAKGFGFVEVEGRDEDLFIPEDKQGGAFHKDTVEVALLPAKTGKRQEAQVIRIIARGMTQVVGTYEQSKSNFGFVIPDNTKIAQDIFVPKEWSKGAMTGHKVVVEITGYGTDTKSPEGKVVEILGHINDPGVDIMSIVRGFDLPVEFGEKIMNQVERVSQEVSGADCAGRRDLRDVTMVTIDGEDAKDLDDAVSVSFDGTYYHLGVHIADVTNYVQENSALDREALKRGTSVYLVDRVIPMLPHALSNGICSLNEGVDRLALSCLMKVDEEGEIVDYEICESVIRVNKRMSYTVVKKLLEEPECVEHNAGAPDGTAGESDAQGLVHAAGLSGGSGTDIGLGSHVHTHITGAHREDRADQEATSGEPGDEQADQHEQHRHENDQDLVLREEKCPGAITDVSRDFLHPFRTGVSLGDHGGLPCGKQQSQNRAQQNYPNDVFHSFHSLNVLYKIECLTLLYHSNNTARFFQVNLPNEQITLNKFYVLPNFFLESF